MILGKLARSLALGSALILAGCDSGGPIVKASADPLRCFPKEAQRWIARTEDAGHFGKVKSAGAAAGGTQRATVYVDRSGSMVGYINGGNNFERPFQDLIATLPASLKLAGLDTAFRSFGTTVSDELPDAGAELLKPDAFVCKPGQKAACDNSESRLDAVLAQVKSNNDDLAVIVSDLWFTNSDIQSTGIAALQPLLTDLLFADKVIAIYGIDAPFNGKIYDLPQAGTATMSQVYSGRHPLYAMVVGSKRAVLDFDAALTNSGSKFLSDGIKGGSIVRSLFTVEPGPLEYDQREPLGASKHPRLRRDNFAIPDGVAIQRFELIQGLPEKPGAKMPQMPQWTGPDPSGFLPHAVWTGPMDTRTRVWMRTSDACSPSSWVEQKTSQTGWSQSATGDLKTFTLDPNRFGAMLLSEGVYMIVGETRRLSVTQPNLETAWMRGEWNLEPARAEAVARSAPATFPTLNLSEFGRIMEAALAAAAERKDQAIIGFTVLVKVED